LIGQVAKCHDQQVSQFKQGKHALAWAAVKAMPTFHYQPLPLTEGVKGCGGCHKHGLKSDEEIQALVKEGSGYINISHDLCWRLGSNSRSGCSLGEKRA
jgi:hypothetical protein